MYYIFFIAGDFNVSSAVWQKSSANYLALLKGGDLTVTLLGDFLSFTNLRQYTVIPNINNRILNLVMSNIDCRTLYCVNSLTEEDAHHRSIELHIKMDYYSTYNFCKADFESINEEWCNMNWHLLFKKWSE